MLSDPEPPPDLLEAFARYAHQNPLVAYHSRTLDGRPWRFSDFVTPRELHALDLYTRVYAKLGVEHQIAFTLPTERGRVLGIALSRSDHDFTDAERDLLADARPFLIQSYLNAIRFTDVLRNPAAIDSPRRGRLMELGLTGRQADVLLLVASGASERTIAERLGISHRTVQKHLERCYRQLGVSSRSQAAAIAWATAEPRADRRLGDRRGFGHLRGLGEARLVGGESGLVLGGVNRAQRGTAGLHHRFDFLGCELGAALLAALPDRLDASLFEVHATECRPASGASGVP